MALNKKMGSVLGVIRGPRPVPAQAEDLTDAIRRPQSAAAPQWGSAGPPARTAAGYEPALRKKEILSWITAYPFV
jgi:hypothetical protein